MMILSLQTLLKRGFTPTLQDLNNHLLFLSKLHKSKLILNFYNQIISNHFKPNSQTHSILTWVLLKTHNFEQAHHFVSTQMGKASNFSKNRIWDSLIRGFCIENDPEKALIVLKDGLRNHGIFPSSLTFRALICSFSCKGEMSRAIQVLELMSDDQFRYPFGDFVCSSVISGFCKMGKHELAVEFFDNAKKVGALRPNVVTCSALVSALCELGRVKEVDELFCEMKNEGLVFDVIFYSTWILGYFKLGILEDAFRKHGQMLENRIKPDVISYTIVIDGFSKDGNVEKSVGFLEKMKRDGLEPNLVTYTAIMLGFCKKGKLEEALSIFKMIVGMGIKMDEFTYATLIDGACMRADFNCVFYLLDDMEKKGLYPTIVTYNTLINGLCKLGRTSEADEISKDIVGDIITYSTLLHGYTEEENHMGILEMKKRLEESGVSMDVVMCNILVKALFMVGAFEDAYTTYKEMHKMNLIADSITYCTMITGYCKVGRIDEALEIFDDFRKTSVSSAACYTSIIHGLCRNNMVGKAIEVFPELGEQGLVLDVGTYRMLIKAIFEESNSEGVINIINRIEYLKPEIYDILCNEAISFLCKRGFFEVAYNVYMTMRKKGSFTMSKSYYTILKGLIGKGKEWLSLPLLNIFIKEHGQVESRVNKILVLYLCMKNVDNAIFFLQNLKSTSTEKIPVSILKALTEDGRALDAYKLIMEAQDNLPIMRVAHYSNVVDGLCKGGHLNKALDLCAFAKKKGIITNIITYNSVLNGLCRQGNLVEALRIFDAIVKIGLVPSLVTYAIVIEALCKEGFLEDAKELLTKMGQKGLTVNTRIYNSLINGYCKSGQMNEALNILVEMETKCLEPDGFTISAVIHGYCVIGDMEGALRFFFEANRKGALPDFMGFLNLIKGLCAKGRMEEARSILREMLGTPSISDLINQVDAEVQTESIQSFLVYLCEQGSIKEAITILAEVRCMILPVGKTLSSYQILKSDEVIVEDNLPTLATDKIDIDRLPEGSKLHDFNDYYSVISSFCSKGELQKANKLVKEVLLSRASEGKNM